MIIKKFTFLLYMLIAPRLKEEIFESAYKKDNLNVDGL